jgi:mono/diheme cytochrome c family protein
MPVGKCRIVLALMIGTASWLAISAVSRFGQDVPTDHADLEAHFKYGSTGGERESGFPYWVWKALPYICPEKLPGTPVPSREYAAFGFLYEEERDLPVGVSRRRLMGMDRVFFNCAVCHTGSVRDKPDGAQLIVAGMPANTVNFMELEKFLFACAKDANFSPVRIVPAIGELGGRLDLLDRYLIYPLEIHLMRDRLIMLERRLAFMLNQPAWGPGRVDAFGFAKALFNFPMEKASAHELIGAADFPSIWLQGPRQDKGMQLHWDGNNSQAGERNRSAAFATGATPPTLDRERLARVEQWLLTREPPPYPFPIDRSVLSKGAAVYGQYCAGCHGKNGRNFDGDAVGAVTPIEQIGTDRRRLDSYTYELAVNQNLLYAGDGDERLSHFRKTFGYANVPLDGLWLRAPYLHNGSVPSLYDLLEPSIHRPKVFYRGSDVYDQQRVGFVSDVPQENGRRYFKFETSIPGNSNRGHEGTRYGTDLLPDEKAALIEYLKTF